MIIIRIEKIIIIEEKLHLQISLLNICRSFFFYILDDLYSLDFDYVSNKAAIPAILKTEVPFFLVRVCTKKFSFFENYEFSVPRTLVPN